MTTIYEPVRWHFTGKLTVFHTSQGMKLTFPKGGIRIVKNEPAVLKINLQNGNVTVLKVANPEWL